MRDHKPVGHWEKRGMPADPLSVLYKRQFYVCKDWVLLRLWLPCLGHVSPSATLLGPKYCEGPIQGLRPRKSKVKIKYWSSISATAKCVRKEWKELPPFQYCHKRVPVSVNINRFCKNVTTQHCVTLLISSWVISISLTTGVQVPTLNLLLKPCEINIATFYVLKEVPSLCQK